MKQKQIYKIRIVRFEKNRPWKKDPFLLSPDVKEEEEEEEETRTGGRETKR